MSKNRNELQKSLVDRIEELANVLQGSSVGEIELTEDGTEVVIRRQWIDSEPVALPKRQVHETQKVVKTTDIRSKAEETSIAITAPLTGAFYLSPSPNLPPFVTIGDNIQCGQVVGLIETMKVFNEVQADAAGRLTQIVASSGAIVKKDDTLFRIETF